MNLGICCMIKGLQCIHLHDALIQNEFYGKCQEYKSVAIQAWSMASASLNKLPPILFLQLENCGGENKNHYLFSFVSMLTTKSIFTIVYVSFLPFGHTHEDIDGTYGRLTAQLKRQDIISLPQIMNTIELSNMIVISLHTRLRSFMTLRPLCQNTY